MPRLLPHRAQTPSGKDDVLQTGDTAGQSEGERRFERCGCGARMEWLLMM